MAEKKQDTSKKVVKLTESLEGIKKLSLQGVSNLKPENPKPSPSVSSQDNGNQSGKDNSGDKK